MVRRDLARLLAWLLLASLAACGLNEGDEAGFVDVGDSGANAEVEATTLPPWTAEDGAETPASTTAPTIPNDDGDGGDGDPLPSTPFSCAAQQAGLWAYEDCDGEVGELTDDPFHALGINCPGTAGTVIADVAELHSAEADAWRIAAGFGDAEGQNYAGQLWAANDREWQNPDGEVVPANTSTAILLLSTGVLTHPNDEGVVRMNTASQIEQGDNANPNGGDLPAPISPDLGSNNGAGGTPFEDCDLVNDCSDSLHEHWNVLGWDDPNDKLWLEMNLTVPVEVSGYVFDFAFMSSEWPDFVNTQYNDLFIAWSTSETYTGNITFVGESPLTVTSLYDSDGFAFLDDAPELLRTGFEGGAATQWFVARGSVVPQETFSLTLFLADMGDPLLASVVLLDNFRWECVGCVPTDEDDCGLGPQ